MILRLSQKLNSKIKAGALPAVPLDENPFADWSAHLFLVQRTQHILVSNTKSLYSVVMYGKGITDDSTFISRTLSYLGEFMADDGLQFIHQRFVAPTTGTIRFAKALDRSVTGSMNELVKFATVWLQDNEISPYEVGFELNDVLISAAATSKSEKYGKPREAFKAMADGIK